MQLDRIIQFFSSLKLTVVCLGLGLVLVFWGTMAQVEMGLYQAQNEFFRSLFIYWKPEGSGLKIPIFPGGYLVGTVLLINLIAAHIQRFELSRKKIGLFLVHSGLILLLVGQLLTDLLSQESMLHLREGETKNYTEADTDVELAIADVTDRDSDKVVAIDYRRLLKPNPIQHEALPFAVEVRKFYVNSVLADRAKDAKEPPPATMGFGPQLVVEEKPPVTAMDKRNVPSAVIELRSGGNSLGTWLVSGYINQPQRFTHEGRTYELSLRRTRLYKPYSIQLLDFRHDVYPGTDIPKNFSSRVRVMRPDTGEDREVLIYMNNPLRYAGETYYQASFDTDNEGTILQVVRNPSWLAPYFACILVSAGLIIQFMMHMMGFVRKRRTA
ncbi:MAG TPA: cytochrome c biogenesis protein ResB [Candidatus Paceibacterota bacterium]|nr:cytochrome c biogenesis protein ResB [Candidatus Paceibacterota bacterium]HRT55274.1 cytochrome c biogenesis protein ResB [Candidatus Paceibacterota bacterium]